MMILIHLAISLFFLYSAGLGVVGFIGLLTYGKDAPFDLKYIIPVIGYCFSQITFWVIYALLGNVHSAFFGSFVVVVVLDLIFIWRLLNVSPHGMKILLGYLPGKTDIKLFAVLAAVFLISSWQYILVGENNYYHSGNEDFFDNILGGVAYLSSTFDRISIDYISDFRLTYSSQAFWRILLHVNGVDGFLIQSILNIMMTSLGVYWLVLSVFKESRSTALLSSFWSVAANFYLTTYLNGHIGSMMYGAVAPVFIGLLIQSINREISKEWLILVLLIFVFSHYTYPGPIYFLLIPAIILAAHERLFVPYGLYNRVFSFLKYSPALSRASLLKKIRWARVLLLVAIMLLAAWGLTEFVYNYFEPRRIQALLRTNVSWKISLFKEMFMIFWGVYPSGSTGTLSALPLFISNEILNSASLIVALIISAVAFLAGISCRLELNKRYLFIYTLMFIPFFIMMRYFWGSPYYFYKFLYVNYFIVVLILFIWLNNRNLMPRMQLIKKTMKVILLFVGVLNIVWTIAIGFDYYNRPYNNKEKIADFFNKTNAAELSKSYLDIPNWIQNMVFTYIFHEHGIKLNPEKTNAKNLIQLNNYADVFHNSTAKREIVYGNGLLMLARKPEENAESIYTLYEPEFHGDVNINWIGNTLSIKNFIIRSSLIELVNFMSQKHPGGSFYFDIVDKDIISLLFRELKNRNVKFHNSTNAGTMFVQLKTDESFFIIHGGEKIIWENEFFRIKLLKKGTWVEVKHFKEKFDFSGLVSILKNRNRSVFLDFPAADPIRLYLVQYFSARNIIVENDAEKTDLICRYYLPLPEMYGKYKSISGPGEKLLWRSSFFDLFKRDWEVELMSIPLNSRSVSPFRDDLDLPTPGFFKQYNGDFKLTITNLSDKAKYLRLLLSPGPSIDNSNFVLHLSGMDNSLDMRKEISNPKTLIDIPISPEARLKKEFSLTLEAEGLIGKSLLPLDDRYLNYQIQSVELTDQIDSYSDSMIKALNNSPKSRFYRLYEFFGLKVANPEIVNAVDRSTILFGMGWYPFEKYNNEGFRWAGEKPAELIIDKKKFGKREIVFDLAPGPGNSSKPVPVDFFAGSVLIRKDTLVQRKKINIVLKDLIEGNNSEFLFLKLIPRTSNSPTPGEPRILNFRVFNIFQN